MEPQILRRFLVLWASRIVLKTAITSNESLKNKFREAERTSIKLIETESHRSFNECCLIYIYYIYIYWKTSLISLSLQLPIKYFLTMVHFENRIDASYCLINLTVQVSYEKVSYFNYVSLIGQL